MLYGDLLPSLLVRNLVQLRAPPRVPNPLPPWYRADRTCAFHHNAPGHDIEHCFPLKEDVQKLIHSKELTFTDPAVQNNPLPPHGPAVNMIQVCSEDGLILKILRLLWFLSISGCAKRLCLITTMVSVKFAQWILEGVCKFKTMYKGC